jgi:hypothetical protein
MPTVTACQRIFIVHRDEYVYLMPFVEDEHTVFRTASSSRRSLTIHDETH